MKKILFVLTAMVTLAFVSCNETPYMPSPGDNDMTKNDTMPEIADPDPDPDPEGIEIPEGAINVNEAVKIGKKLAAGQTTEQTYYIKGWVRNFDEEARSKSEPDWETSFAKYGNDYVHMSAREDGQGLKDFYCYRVLGRGGAKLPNHDVLQIGDFIVVKCKIQNYSGTIESSGTCSIEVSNNEAYNAAFPPIDTTNVTPDAEGVDVPEGTINVYKAREISEAVGSGNTTTENYYIKGWISRITEGVSSYGNATFFITPTNDGTTSTVEFEGYRVKGKDGRNLTNANQVVVGDFVVLRSQIKNYNGTAETADNAFIYSSSNENFTNAFPPIDTVYATCAQAKEVVATMQNNETTNDIYVIEGYVQSEGYDATISRGQQKFIWLDDVKEGTKVVQGYYCNVPNGVAVPIGTKVRMIGPITKYSGNPEIKNGNVEIIEEAQ